MRKGIGWLLVGLACAVAPAAAEDITLTTYYPSPRGIYRELRATNNAFLAQSAGAMVVGGRVLPTAAGVGALKLIVGGAGVNAGVVASCPPNSFWFDENTNGARDTGECRPLGLTIKQDGMVGIGTADPTQRLHLIGSSPGNSVWLDDGAGKYIALSTDGALGVSLWAGGSSNPDLYINNTTAPLPPRNTLLNVGGGRVGIGTTTPATTLDVNGPVLPGRLDADPPVASSVEGMLYYNTGVAIPADEGLRLFKNGAWGPLGGAAAPGALAGYCIHVWNTFSGDKDCGFVGLTPPATCVGPIHSQTCACEAGYSVRGLGASKTTGDEIRTWWTCIAL